MSTLFPTTIDTLTNPISTDTLASPSHSDQHSNINDAVEALETKVGVDSSAVTGSLDYRVSTSETDVSTLKTDVSTIETALPIGDIVGTSDTQILTNKTLTSPVVTGGTLNSGNALTVNSTELNLLDNQTVLRKQTLYGSSNGTGVAAGETKYIGSWLTTSAYVGAIIVSSSGTLSNLKFYSGVVPGVGKNYVATVMVNNSASTLTCTISGDATNSGEDSTHSVAVSAGNFVTLRVVADAGATTCTVQWSALFVAS